MFKKPVPLVHIINARLSGRPIDLMLSSVSPIPIISFLFYHILFILFLRKGFLNGQTFKETYNSNIYMFLYINIENNSIVEWSSSFLLNGSMSCAASTNRSATVFSISYGTTIHIEVSDTWRRIRAQKKRTRERELRKNTWNRLAWKEREGVATLMTWHDHVGIAPCHGLL